MQAPHQKNWTIWIALFVLVLLISLYRYTDFGLYLYATGYFASFNLVVLAGSVLFCAFLTYKLVPKYRGYAVVIIPLLLGYFYFLAKATEIRGQHLIISNPGECSCIASNPVFVKTRGGGYYSFHCIFRYHEKVIVTGHYPTKNLAVKSGDTLTVVYSLKMPEINFIKEYQKGVPGYERGFTIGP